MQKTKTRYSFFENLNHLIFLKLCSQFSSEIVDNPWLWLEIQLSEMKIVIIVFIIYYIFSANDTLFDKIPVTVRNMET